VADASNPTAIVAFGAKDQGPDMLPVGATEVV